MKEKIFSNNYILFSNLFLQIRRVPVDSAVEASEPGPETAESSLYEPPSDSTVFGTRYGNNGKRCT